MRALIIDDEPNSHAALKELLSRYHSDIQVLESAYSVQQGLEVIQKHQPQLIFLDIELPDGLGFDLLNTIGEPDFHVIFITAYNHYARTAIGFGALHYLSKPIDREDLSVALDRARHRMQKYITQQQLQIIWETLQNLPQKRLPSRIGISTSEGILYKLVNSVIRLEAQQNYTEFTLHNEYKKILASINIGEYEQQFSPYREFMRVHRSHLINLSYVDKYVRSDGGYLVMKDGQMVSVSKVYREELIQRMQGL